MYKFKLIYSFISLALLALGFAFSFWPLCLIGLLLAAFLGNYAVAIGIGLVMDLAFGEPVGRFHFLHVPFMLLALLICVLRHYLSAYFLQGYSGRL